MQLLDKSAVETAHIGDIVSGNALKSDYLRVIFPVITPDLELDDMALYVQEYNKAVDHWNSRPHEVWESFHFVWHRIFERDGENWKRIQ